MVYLIKEWQHTWEFDGISKQVLWKSLDFFWPFDAIVRIKLAFVSMLMIMRQASLFALYLCKNSDRWEPQFVINRQVERCIMWNVFVWYWLNTIIDRIRWFDWLFIFQKLKSNLNWASSNVTGPSCLFCFFFTFEGSLYVRSVEIDLKWLLW